MPANRTGLGLLLDREWRSLRWAMFCGHVAYARWCAAAVVDKAVCAVTQHRFDRALWSRIPVEVDGAEWGAIEYVRAIRCSRCGKTVFIPGPEAVCKNPN